MAAATIGQIKQAMQAHSRDAVSPAYIRGYGRGYNGGSNRWVEQSTASRDDYWLGWMHGESDGRVDRSEE